MSLFRHRDGSECRPIYREIIVPSVPRRVCDRRVVKETSIWRQRPGPKWGERFVLISVPRISLIEKRHG